MKIKLSHDPLNDAEINGVKVQIGVPTKGLLGEEYLLNEEGVLTIKQPTEENITIEVMVEDKPTLK